MSLPGDFAYNSMKPSSVPAKGYTSLIPPDAGQTFTQGQIINISIPCSRFGEYLRRSESDLRFKVNNTATAPTATVDASDRCCGIAADVDRVLNQTRQVRDATRKRTDAW